MAGVANVYCLDASACAQLSEDFAATTRWHFQRELVTVHSGAAARQPSAGVALVAAAAGRASVTLHPTTDAEALQAALREVEPAGEASLDAALKLALLVSRRFPEGKTHVTAFVASGGAVSSLARQADAAAELRRRYTEAAVSLDVAVLCTREELGAECTTALAALVGDEAADASSSGGGGGEGEGTPPAASSSTRLLWLTPVDAAAESWQQLEPALEQLESGGRRGSSDASSGSGSGSSSGARSALPSRISRAPRQNPRTSLLAARSGVQQPALCRGESLSRFGHLSSDGMARPWLPTYSSLGQAAKGAAAAAAAGAGAPAEMCYVEVQPLPRWRTLIKVAAGRMLAAPAGGTGGSRPGSGNYAAASSQLLQSLEALSVLDDDPEGSSSSDGSSDGSGPACEAAAAPAPVRYLPDSARGTLRLLQGTKEPHLLKLVWSAKRSSSNASAGSTAAGAQQQQQRQQGEQPLNMFAPASSGPGSSSSGGSSSASRAALLGYMPAATVEASAARGPIVREGCELWEAAAEFDWELLLPTPEGGSSGGSGGGSAPAAIEARQLPNGAQLVLVTTTGAGTRSSSSTLRRAGGQAAKPAAAFWLQQRLAPDGLQMPAYGTAPGSGAAAEADGESAAGETATPAVAQPEGQPAQEQQDAAGAAAGPAALLAEALQRLVRQPPAVDLRRLRKDVKSGEIQVTPITVGPLPAQFVRDIVGARSALMSSMGVENLDCWGDGPSSGSASASTGGAPSSASGAAASGCGSGGGKAEAGGAPAAGSTAGSSGGSGKGLTPEAAATAMQQHKSAVLSLLRKRLNRHSSGKAAASSSGSGSSAGEAEAPPPHPPPAAADEGSGTPAAAAPAATGAIPCSPPIATPEPPAASSYSSSMADTPFGTPMAILPSRLAHADDGSPSQAAAGAEGKAGAAGAVAGGSEPGLPGDGSQLLQPKREGSHALLVGAPSQGDSGDRGDHTLFQLE